MKDNRGFIELNNVSDYWKKLLFDYNELKKDNENTYKAFNFFVTAYHLLDWIFEGKYPDERIELNKISILKICNHIANGIKHFEPDRHGSVIEIEKQEYFEKGCVEDGYVESPIMIYLEDDYISEFGNYIPISDLADKIIKFWNNELNMRDLI